MGGLRGVPRGHGGQPPSPRRRHGAARPLVVLLGVLLAAALTLAGVPGLAASGLAEAAPPTSEAHDAGSDLALRAGSQQGAVVARAGHPRGGALATATRPVGAGPAAPQAPAHALPMWRGPPPTAD